MRTRSSRRLRSSPYAYLDSSALAKFVVAEPETAALERDAAGRRDLLSSRLGATELRRAVRRAGHRRVLQQVEGVLDSVVLVELSPVILDRAGHLPPSLLRTLDAIHLATALSLNLSECDFITYDDRLADAAAASGLHVLQPR
ncbi:MAG: type II toxin-antitoxin system VapC family toxin [Vicinamibacterales bacterium]